MTGRNNQNLNQNYIDFVSFSQPKTNEIRSLLRAFWVGGFICCIGQTFRLIYEVYLGLSGDELASYVSMTMIFLGAF